MKHKTGYIFNLLIILSLLTGFITIPVAAAQPARAKGGTLLPTASSSPLATQR